MENTSIKLQKYTSSIQKSKPPKFKGELGVSSRNLITTDWNQEGQTILAT